jgi:hypothetical protein
MADKTQKYVVNMDFGQGSLGEVIEAAPKLVADWEQAGFISPIDDAGNRIVQIGRRTGVDEGAAPVAVPGEPRQVTKDDLDQSA